MNWAPANSYYWCDHTAINFDPELFEKVLLPAAKKINDAFDCGFMYCYPAEGPHVFPPIWDHCEKLVGIHNCQGEMPGQSGAAMKGLGDEGEKLEWETLAELYKERVGKKAFIVKCPPERIPFYRDLFGDVGLCIWTFAKDPEDAKKILGEL